MDTIVPSFSIGSSSNWQVTRAGLKSQMSINSGQIRSLTLELLALECLKKVVDMIAPLLFIESWSNLQVINAGINSPTSSIFGQMKLFTSEVLAIEGRKLFA